jgi:hypothetical protein
LNEIAPPGQLRRYAPWLKDGDFVQLAAGFIEYFITGSGALLWLVPLFAMSRPNASTLNAGNVLLLAPLLYAFGMAVDFASNTILGKLIRRIHSSDREHLLPRDLSETAFINYRSATLARAIELRSTRDRIARGFFFNLLVTTLVVFFRDVSWLVPIPRYALLSSLIGLSVVAFGAWWRFERLTYRLRKHAVRAIMYDTSAKTAHIDANGD